LTVSDEAAGHSGQCPYCQADLQVPRDGVMPAADWAKARASAALAPFDRDQGERAFPDLRKPPRRGWLGVGLAVLLALAAVGGLAYYLHEPAPPAMRSPEALRYLPDHFQFYFVASYDRITGSPAFQEFEKLAKRLEGDGMDQEDLTDWLGIEPKDLRALTGGFAVLSNRRSTDVAMSMLIETTQPLDHAKIQAHLKQRQFQESRIDSHVIHTGRQDVISVSICILNDRSILLGEEKTVRAVLTRNRNARVDDGMRALMAQLDDSKAMALVADMKSLLGQREVAKELNNQGGQAKKFLTELNSAFIYFDMNDQVQFDAVLTCRSAETAEEMRKAADGLLAMGRFMIPADLPPTVLELYDSLKVTAKGNQVFGQSHVKVDALMKLFKDLENRGAVP
jgi:hypothetical protein